MRHIVMLRLRFRAIPLEEAEKLMSEDSAVKAGVFRVEYHRWSSDHVLPR
jgi:hypothetical protein